MAGIIKSGEWQSGPASPHTSRFNFEDIAQKAEAYLDEVKRQSERIVADAKVEAQKIAEEAAKQGRESAELAAERRLVERLGERLDELVPAFRHAVEEIEKAKQSWLAHWERETISLAAVIAERIIRRELRLQPEIPLELVREALQLAIGGGELKLHLNPTDVDSVNPWLERLTGELGKVVPAEVVADSKVSPGGCRVLTQFGVIDQTVEAQLGRITEELL